MSGFDGFISSSQPIDLVQALKPHKQTSHCQDMAQQPFYPTQAQARPILPSWGVFLAVRGLQGNSHPGSPALVLSSGHLLWGFQVQSGLRGLGVAVLGQQGVFWEPTLLHKHMTA